MELLPLGRAFTVCKTATLDGVRWDAPFVFVSKTDDELSVVCETADTPKDATDAEHGWLGLKIAGMLDFGMVGVIAGISRVLADGGVSIFVVSTYNTDYILLRAAQYDKAVSLLSENGYRIAGED